MKRLTAKQLQRPHLGVVINDLVLLPPLLPISRYAWAWKKVRKILPTHIAKAFEQLPGTNSINRCYFNLQDSFSEWADRYHKKHFSHQKLRPTTTNYSNDCIWATHGHEWWPKLPAAVRADLCHYVWRLRATIIVPFVERTGISYVILENGFIDRVITRLKVFRLSFIKQLAYLTGPVIYYLNGDESRGETFGHTRFLHSLDVLAIATCMGWNLGIRGAQLRCLQFAALTHDILTPAGGDATKRVSPEALDEDVNFRKVFERQGFSALERDYQLNRELIFSTIQNDGLLGQILDIADKLGYVSRDLPCYLIHNEPQNLERELLPNEYEKIAESASGLPMLCSVWDSFVLIDKQLVCTTAERLAEFLYIRILLFRQFYANPAGRFHEATTIRITLEHLLTEGVITVPKLLDINDTDLECLIGKVLGLPHWDILNARAVGEPGFQTFECEQMAIDFIDDLADKGQYPLLCEHLQPYLKRSSGKFTVIASDGSLQSLAAAYPDLDDRLKEAERLPEPWAVYWLKRFRSDTSELFKTLVYNNMRRRFQLSPK